MNIPNLTLPDCFTTFYYQSFHEVIYMIYMLDTLACSGCFNKIPQTEWLKQETFISHGSRGWEV